MAKTTGEAMKIIQLTANWYAWNDGREAGAECETYDVGKKGVVSITEHRPAGEGDKWFYDVEFENKGTKRIFNPNSVSMEKP